jgi:DNA-binding transcriptional ArsR family regulator
MARYQPNATDLASCSLGDPCTARQPLQDRPLFSFVEAVKVMALFKVLANDTRIRILHHIVRSGEATVTDIAKSLGMKPQAVSNQLMRLSDTRMLSSRREGNNVFYRVMNGCVSPLLDLALCLMEDEGRFGRTAGGPDAQVNRRSGT